VNIINTDGKDASNLSDTRWQIKLLLLASVITDLFQPVYFLSRLTSVMSL